MILCVRARTPPYPPGACANARPGAGYVCVRMSASTRWMGATEP